MPIKLKHLKKRINKKSQVETLDNIFAFLVFILFMTIIFWLLKYYHGNATTKYINRNLIEEFYNKTQTEVIYQPIIINTTSNLGYNLISIPLLTPYFYTSLEHVVINNTLYVIQEIKKNLFYITYLHSKPNIKESVYPVTFTCNEERCILPPFHILYHFSKGVLDHLTYYNQPMINLMLIKQDDFYFNPENFSNFHHKIFYDFESYNFLTYVLTRIVNHNPHLFIKFEKKEKNVPFTKVTLILDLPKYDYFSTASYNRVKLDYSKTITLNKTLCYNDITRFISLMNEFQLIISSDKTLNITLCIYNQTTHLNVSFNLYDNQEIKILPASQSYDPITELSNYNIILGMPIKKYYISEKALHDLFVEGTIKLDLDEKSNIVISDKKGKLLYTFNKQYYQTNAVETYLNSLIHDMGNFSIEPCYVSFIRWQD